MPDQLQAMMCPVPQASPVPLDVPGTFALADITAMLRRRGVLILGCVLGVLALAVAYVTLATPIYIATGRVVLDTMTSRQFEQDSGGREMTVDSSMVESQVETIRSDAVLTAVVRRFNLVADEEFGADRPPSTLSGILGARPALSAQDRERRVLESFGTRLTVRRIATSRVIEITLRSRDPNKAAQLAAGVAEAYLQDLLAARTDAARKATAWLDERLAELRERLSQATQAVQEFRTQNNLTLGANRVLLNEQQLGEQSSQLTAARAAVAETRAKLERLEAVLTPQGADEVAIADAGLSESLRNEVLVRLRQQYLDTAAREAEFSARFGREHRAAQQLREQMQELRRSITNELRRVEQSYRNEYEVARAREQDLAQGLRNAVGASAGQRQAQARLRELESVADTYRVAFENLLQRYAGAVQQQSFPIADARIITPPARPLEPSSPKTELTLLLGLVLGGILGLGAAIVRERLDHGLRRPEQIRGQLGLPHLGTVPRLRGAKAGWAYRAVTRDPTSGFADALREVKLSVDAARSEYGLRTIGVVALDADAGASTLAANLAQLQVMTGTQVLLVDADLRRGSLTRAMAEGNRRGLAEALVGGDAVAPVPVVAGTARLGLVPAGGTLPAVGTAEMLGTPAMARILEELRTQAELIVVDLPPLSVAADARMLAPMLDGLVVVAENDRTQMDALAEELRRLAGLRVAVLGVVINKASAGRRKRAGSAKGYR